MNRRTRIIVIAATFTTVLALPAAAQAADPAANDYGQHVRHCAQTMGFSGDHNPGMHHGNAGWTGMTCQL
jgi:hypothetical protein